MSDKGKKTKIVIIVGIIFLLIIIIVIFVFGVRGIFKIIGTIGVVCLFLGLIFAIAWLFWAVFLKKYRYDVTYVNKHKLIQAGKMSRQGSLMGNLYLSGDKTHSRVNIGKIVGYCRIQVLTRTNKYNKENKMIMITNKEGIEEPDFEIGKEEQDVFIIGKSGLIGMFSDPYVIRVSPSDHDELIGDVTLKGFSLLPQSEYFFLNSDYLDVRKIDFAILKEAERGIMFESLRDMKSIVDKAVGLDALHKKEIEKKNLVEIPEQVTAVSK